MLLSINQLWEFNGARSQDRYQETRELNLYRWRKECASYESSQALPLIYSVDNLEAARAKQALSQASLNALREEDLRKQRIPIQIVLDLIDKVFQSIGSTLKAAKGKKLTLRQIPGCSISIGLVIVGIHRSEAAKT
jgi:hypothetical protein